MRKIPAGRRSCATRRAVTLAPLVWVACVTPSRGVRLQAAQGAPRPGASVFDVKAFGAKGDGTAIDTAAINRAIDAATAAGVGTVHFPAGIYPSFSIHLGSHVGLFLDHGATLVAAQPGGGAGAAGIPGADVGYDAHEPNQWDKFQDFGHSHWHNSLIWGEQIEACRNVRISNATVNSPFDDGICPKRTSAPSSSGPSLTRGSTT